jgi:hypothetical protein
MRKSFADSLKKTSLHSFLIRAIRGFCIQLVVCLESESTTDSTDVTDILSNDAKTSPTF